MTAQIPKQLHRCRVIKLGRHSKIPKEEGWVLTPELYERQQDKTWKKKSNSETYLVKGKSFTGEIANYTWDSPELQKWLVEGGNYGVLCGAGYIAGIDADSYELQEAIEKGLPPTFKIRSGGRSENKEHPEKHHYYFLIRNPTLTQTIPLTLSPAQEKKNLGHIRWNNGQLVGPGSIHPSGRIYEVVSNIPIAEIECSEFLKVLSPWIFQAGHNVLLEGQTFENPLKEMKITDIVSIAGMTNKGAGKHQGAHPFHESTTDWDFEIDTQKNVWYCFAHNVGGSVAELIAMQNKILECWNCGKGSLPKEKFKEVLTVAKKTKPELFIGNDEDFYERFHSIASFEVISKKLAVDLGICFDKNQIWWLWHEKNNAWKIVDETDIMNLIDSAIRFNASTLESKVKNLILEGLKREGRKNKPKELDRRDVQFKDLIINYENGEIKPATKEYFATNPIPWEIGETENTPTIDKLFTDWVGDKKPLLYEIIAFSMAREYFIHRLFCFVGSGRNGKSQYLKLVQTFLGIENVSSTELELLQNSKFETTKLHKKLACFMGETNFSLLEKTSKIKRLTGQDLIPIEYKGKSGFDYENYATVFIATNSLPTTADKTEGFYSRWQIVDFPNRFKEHGDIIDQIPPIEYANLAKKSIRILAELAKTFSFSFEGNITQRAQNYEEHSNPLSKFLEQEYRKDVNGQIPFFELYESFENFLKSTGQRSLTKRDVGSQLEEMGYEKDYQHPPGEQNKKWLYVLGISKKGSQGSEGSHIILDSHIEKLSKTSLPSLPSLPFGGKLPENRDQCEICTAGFDGLRLENFKVDARGRRLCRSCAQIQGGSP